MPKRKSRSKRSSAPAKGSKAKARPAAAAKRRTAGRPEFVPTDAQKNLVKSMAGYRIPQDEMALLVINPGTNKPISETTLKKVFAEELAQGYANLRVRIMAASVRSALGIVKQGPNGETIVEQQGNVTAQIWLQKTLYGAREPGRGPGDDQPPPPVMPGDEGTPMLDAARRVAFVLARGAAQAKAAKKAA